MTFTILCTVITFSVIDSVLLVVGVLEDFCCKQENYKGAECNRVGVKYIQISVSTLTSVQYTTSTLTSVQYTNFSISTSTLTSV